MSEMEMTFLRKYIKDNGMTMEELDHITDNIYNTVTHPKGRKLFELYLDIKSFNLTLKFQFSQCLNLYDTCLAIKKLFKNKRRRTSEELKILSSNVRMMQKLINFLKFETLYFLPINKLSIDELSDTRIEETLKKHDILQDMFDIEKKCEIFLHDEHGSFRDICIKLT